MTTRTWRPHRPRSVRGWLLTIGAVAVAALLGGVALVYVVAFGTSSPPPLTLSSPSPGAGAGAGPAAAAASPSSLSAAGLAGTWTAGSGSVAGYRVREQLAFLSAPSDAVGRTSSVTGSATLAGASDVTVTAASFSVDVSSLTSDRSMRDDRIHSIGLESDRYPTATFELSSPIALPASAASGGAVTVPATGRLTIHGTTTGVTVPLRARLGSSVIEVVGSITFPWSEFGMTAPSIGGFVSVTDQATMEFDLHLVRA